MYEMSYVFWAPGRGGRFLDGSAGAIPSRTEAVPEAIRHAIPAGEMKPGQSLVEADLAQRLGVSKTPAREGLKTLAGSGLVTPGVPGWQREAAAHRAILAAAGQGDAARAERLLREHIGQFAARHFPGAVKDSTEPVTGPGNSGRQDR